MKYYLQEFAKKEKPIAVDDMILTKDSYTTAGSKMLSNYTSLFEAEAVTRIQQAGYSISGKANIGEFGLDVIEETSYFSDNAKGKGAIAELVKNNIVPCGLSVDNNGAPRRAAAISDINYIKPSYGVISRYGLIPTVCSSEGIGISSASTENIIEVLNTIAGKDSKDGTMFPEKSYKFSTSSVSGNKIAVLKNYFEHIDTQSCSSINDSLHVLKDAGATIDEINFEIAEEVRTAWNIALCAETCNNLSRYDGVKFGYRVPKYNSIEELYTGSRTESFGLLVKSIILYGSDVLSKGRYDNCYDKALRMRAAAKAKLNQLFNQYDLLVLPACSKQSFSSDDLGNSIDALFKEELFSSISSLTGIPCAVSGSAQFLANTLQENNLLSVMAALEER